MMSLKSDDLKKAAMEYYVYVPLGAGKVMFDAAKDVYGKVATMAKDPTALTKRYEDLATRGEKIVTGIRKSAYTKRAVDQTKTARSQVKAAATSVRKAAASGATATKAAARKVG